MSEVVVEFDRVWKKFRRGEIHDSLRDLIPSMFGRVLPGKGEGEALREEEFWAVKDLSFEVRRGEALGVIGANGAGKSTTLKLLTRILQPTHGEIKVKGRISALIEVGAGFHPDLTGRENVYLNGAILGMKRAEVKRKFDEIVAFSGLEDFIDTPVKRYSSGMYARLGFAVAAHVDPDILIVDEVLSVGDMKFQEKCLDKMLSLPAKGTTVIFVSHNFAAVTALCPSAALLVKGQLKTVGPTSDVMLAYMQSMQQVSEETSLEGPIRRVYLCHPDGSVAERLIPGNRASLRFQVDASLPLQQCLLSFIVKRITDGLHVCDYNLEFGSLHEGSEDTREFSLEFDANLLRGAYVIVLHLYHQPTAKFLAHSVSGGHFTVEEAISFQGVAHLAPSLTEAPASLPMPSMTGSRSI